ncbi:glycosyltransferase family 2 protein [Streptomyces aidingensis]|uniref:Glycosyl transferase family 2 n=1 Tax=Streptomyces aidingensis TaxID=910347 RepID=A0A1I1RHU4_9ACTN|nr:glycosyltransferase family A protein [Streptomyces aidingensis]SFD31818.1 Glycosyl transferase family 2 [Streptomyces aidingensis]
MPPAVSVVVPCYNAARTLPACLAAIAAQRVTPDEVVVVDDASTDASAAVARAAGVRVVDQPVNRGVSAARNRGAAETTAEVIFYVDADVALAPDALENALAILDAEPETGCVHGIYETTPLIDDGPLEHYKILSNHYWRRRATGLTGTALFALGAIRREVLERAGGFDESLRDGEDVELSIRLRPLCAIRLTGTVAGRHDDADRWRAVLGEQYRRSRLLVPMALAERRDRRPGPDDGSAPTLTGQRPAAVAATALALGLAVLALPAAAAPAGGWWAVPAVAAVAALAGGLLADPGLLAFVRRERGTRYLVFFLAAQAAVLITLVLGAARGALSPAALRRAGAASRVPVDR